MPFYGNDSLISFGIILIYFLEKIFKTLKENLFMTAEGAKGNYDQAKAVILATDNFRDQVINHLGSQQFLGNFKISESLVNECSKQQDMWDFEIFDRNLTKF